MCFVDLVADNLVSCIVIIDGGFWGFVIRSCRHGMVVLSEEAFQVMAYDSWLVSGTGPGGGDGLWIGGGLGCVYSFMGPFYLNASIIIASVGMRMLLANFGC